MRVRSDAFSTTYKISSNRSNAGPWKVRQGRSEAGCRSVVGGVAPLGRRRRARAGSPNGPTRRRIVCRLVGGKIRGCPCVTARKYWQEEERWLELRKLRGERKCNLIMHRAGTPRGLPGRREPVHGGCGKKHRVFHAPPDPWVLRLPVNERGVHESGVRS